MDTTEPGRHVDVNSFATADLIYPLDFLIQQWDNNDDDDNNDAVTVAVTDVQEENYKTNLPDFQVVQDEDEEDDIVEIPPPRPRPPPLLPRPPPLIPKPNRFSGIFNDSDSVGIPMPPPPPMRMRIPQRCDDDDGSAAAPPICKKVGRCRSSLLRQLLTTGGLRSKWDRHGLIFAEPSPPMTPIPATVLHRICQICCVQFQCLRTLVNHCHHFHEILRTTTATTKTTLEREPFAVGLGGGGAEDNSESEMTIPDLSGWGNEIEPISISRPKIVHSCWDCKAKFATAVDLTCHQVKHALELSRRCVVRVRTPRTTKLFFCEICSGTFCNAYNLKVHLDLHSGQNFECSACPHTTRSRDSLRKHFVYRHRQLWASGMYAVQRNVCKEKLSISKTNSSSSSSSSIVEVDLELENGQELGHEFDLDPNNNSKTFGFGRIDNYYASTKRPGLNRTCLDSNGNLIII